MYAVIATGGKQYRVSEGQSIKVERLPLEEGKQVEFDQVLMVAGEQGIQLGTPLLADIKVSADVIKHGRHRKIRIIKFKRRKHHMKRQGHRQDFTEVKITAIGKPAQAQPKAAPKKQASDEE